MGASKYMAMMGKAVGGGESNEASVPVWLCLAGRELVDNT
jgi:hypothetical protein